MQHELYKHGSARVAAPPPPKLARSTTALKGDPQLKRRNLGYRTRLTTRLSGTSPAGCQPCNRKGTDLVRTWSRESKASPQSSRTAAKKSRISTYRCCQNLASRKACCTGRHDAQPPQTVPEERRRPFHRSQTYAMRISENLQTTTDGCLKAGATYCFPGHQHTQVATISQQKASERTGSGTTAP